MPHSEEEALAFWSKRHASYPLLAPHAEDLLINSASTTGIRSCFQCLWVADSRASQFATASPRNPEKRVFVRMNQGLL